MYCSHALLAESSAQARSCEELSIDLCTDRDANTASAVESYGIHGENACMFSQHRFRWCAFQVLPACRYIPSLCPRLYTRTYHGTHLHLRRSMPHPTIVSIISASTVLSGRGPAFPSSPEKPRSITQVTSPSAHQCEFVVPTVNIRRS